MHNFCVDVVGMHRKFPGSTLNISVTERTKGSGAGQRTEASSRGTLNTEN